MTVRLTDAVAEDPPALAGILEDWVQHTAWMPKLHSREETVGFLHHLMSGHRLRVARQGDVPLGFLARKAGVIDALYLGPLTRRRGVGGLLIAEAKAERVAEGGATLGLWTFQANRAARLFYASQGFVAMRATDGAGNEEKLPDLWLEWQAREGAAS